MFCPQCGKQNEETSMHCTQCGSLINMAAAAPPPTPQQFVPPPQYQGAPPPVPAQIPNYMVQAVLITLFCCLPLGIVGIVKANGINKKIAAGDLAGALADSNSNKTLLWIGFGVGLVINAFWIMSRLHS